MQNMVHWRTGKADDYRGSAVLGNAFSNSVCLILICSLASLIGALRQFQFYVTETAVANRKTPCKINSLGSSLYFKNGS